MPAPIAVPMRTLVLRLNPWLAWTPEHSQGGTCEPANVSEIGQHVISRCVDHGLKHALTSAPSAWTCPARCSPPSEQHLGQRHRHRSLSDFAHLTRVIPRGTCTVSERATTRTPGHLDGSEVKNLREMYDPVPVSQNPHRGPVRNTWFARTAARRHLPLHGIAADACGTDAFDPMTHYGPRSTHT